MKALSLLFLPAAFAGNSCSQSTARDLLLLQGDRTLSRATAMELEQRRAESKLSQHAMDQTLRRKFFGGSQETKQIPQMDAETSDVEIVLAHHAENLSWLQQLAGLNVSVYTNGPREESDLLQESMLPSTDILIQKIPNVGRESHAYLYHIVHNYDRLANWTVFTQGGEPSFGYKGHRSGGGHLLAGDHFANFLMPHPSGSRFVYTSAVHLPSMNHILRAAYCINDAQLEGANVAETCPRNTSLWTSWWDIGNFAHYIALKVEQQHGELAMDFYHDYINPTHTGSEVTAFFAQGARFAVSSKVIKQRPKADYERLLAVLSTSEDPYAGYFMEWFWSDLFLGHQEPCRVPAHTTPISHAEALDILAKRFPSSVQKYWGDVSGGMSGDLSDISGAVSGGTVSGSLFGAVSEDISGGISGGFSETSTTEESHVSGVGAETSTSLVPSWGSGSSGKLPRGTHMISLDVILRDFTADHPDFQSFDGHSEGLVMSKLGDDKKPVYKGGLQLSSKENFDQWFRDVPEVNRRLDLKMNFSMTQDGSYVHEDSSFFPLDGLGWNDTAIALDGNPHNFYFTLEMHTSFIYQGGEIFTFRGDDDVWVFIDGNLVIDLGGVHDPMERTVVIDSLNITTGTAVSLDFFFAERRCCGSKFRVETSIMSVKSTCTVWGDPHVDVFDNGLFRQEDRVEPLGIFTSGDYWLVRSRDVSIQGRYGTTIFTPSGQSALLALALSGPFLANHTLIIEPDEGKVTFDDKRSLRKLIRAFMLRNVDLTVNRWPKHLDASIRMPQQVGGQDGHCGNFNLNATDDSQDQIMERIGRTIPPGESLFLSSQHVPVMAEQRNVSLEDCDPKVQKEAEKSCQVLTATRSMMTMKTCIFDYCYGSASRIVAEDLVVEQEVERMEQEVERVEQA
eukprot:CAMPEP_0197635060 /NCGR_PEP_ID=MMETSP1338-20131121/10980_1 /TAXON_ID=43686 ORGANISM="Pelagodinium beii, Strain RCC1491" /NCGR_SAMPLE_ID=MMETSP1338 /ASSEMBLY_ACC=CAM_ASM_000754 /LENGTH=903 /DNA_ID=CAMNT_0043207039 /DNA_START=66 /DNA_END=2778 /DNA_ORIENTATION=-